VGIYTTIPLKLLTKVFRKSWKSWGVVRVCKEKEFGGAFPFQNYAGDPN